MSEITRRTALSLGAAAAVAAAVPGIPFAAPAPPPTPAWAVGTPGEFDWQHCVGNTELEAKLDWLIQHVGTDECYEGHELGAGDCDCEACFAFGSVDASRVEAWDGKDRTTAADWLNAGMGCYCDRCNHETSDDYGYAVGAEAVCLDCMKLADWEIVDPERAAEMRAAIKEE